jgi:zinc protease
MKLKLLLLVTLIIGVCCSVASQAKLVEKVGKNGSEIVIPYEKYTLPNGLTLIVHEDHSDPIVHVDVTYHVGSAREEIGKSGFAHFFEHMMFQGSDHVADEQHFKIVTEAGGTLNGSTNRDRTNYFETVPSNQLEKMLWLEADRMGFLLDAVTQTKFEVQRATVKNERGQNYDNRPYGLVFETASRNLYPYGHPYSWLTIGYIEELNRVNVNDLKNFFLRWYGPNNATVTVGGDVKPAEVVSLVEKYFGPIPKGPEVQKVNVPPVMLDKTRYVSFTDNYARVPMLAIVYPTVPVYHPDMGALQCLAQVLGQGKNSILYQDLVKTQKALQATASSQLSELAGEFNFTILPLPGNTIADMEKNFRNALQDFEKRGVTDDDIAKFKGSVEAQQINGLQSVQGKVSQLAAFQTFSGNPNKIADLLKMYSSVTKEDVMKAYEKYIKGKNSVVVSVLTKGQDSAMVAAPDNYTVDQSNYKAPDYGYAGLKYTKPTDNFERKKIPGNGPNPVVKVPVFWRKDLQNGIKMIGTENTEIPTVTLSITIPGGHLLEAKDTSKIGIASFFTDMMGEDTKNYTAEQFAVELQKLGSTINIFSSTDGITFNVQSLKKNLDKTLALLQERMFNPKFTEDAFKRNQKQSLESFKQMKSQPASIANEVAAKITYGPNHILGMSQDGTEYTVKNFTLQDVENYFSNNMTSRGTKVIIVGDIKQNEIVPRLGFLNKLPNKRIDIPAVAPAPIPTTNQIYLVDVPKAAQTEFRVGYATNMKYDATGEFYKAGLMNYILGGAFNSRLNLKLREEKGWTYGARSGFSGDKYSGDFEFSSGIKSDATDSALSEVVNQMKTYAQSGMSDEEFRFMKSAIGQRDARNYETGFQKAQFIGRILDYNLPADYIDQQNKILKKITREELNSLAKKWVDANKLNMVMVGDKAKILPGLQKLGYPIIELDVDGKKVEKKAF